MTATPRPAHRTRRGEASRPVAAGPARSLGAVTPTPPPDPHRPLASIAGRVQGVLDEFLTDQRASLTEIAAELAPLVDTARGFLAGGKRLRPAFCYWGWRAAATHHQTPILAGSALELFQAAALVHDDLIDASDTRRGSPSVHRRFEAAHRDAGWAGSASGFGLAAAILLGDLLLGWSDEVFEASSNDREVVARGRVIFERMRTEVGGGQYLDVLEQARGHQVDDPAEMADRAMRVVRFKSARYSVEHPVVMGATMGGADTDMITALHQYGAALGASFQLRDDILGVFGDPAVTGKPAGDDLREGKRTLLVAHALERATPIQRNALAALLGRPDLDEPGVSRARDVIEETGALRRVEAMVDDGVAAAANALDQADISPDGHLALTGLIHAATARTT